MKSVFKLSKMHLNDKVPPAAACAIHYHFLKKVDENFGFKVSSECDNTSERRVLKLLFLYKAKAQNCVQLQVG